MSIVTWKDLVNRVETILEQNGLSDIVIDWIDLSYPDLDVDGLMRSSTGAPVDISISDDYHLCID